MRLSGKNAVVAGAGSGIGRAIALGFAREGACVVCGDINADTSAATARQIQDQGGEAISVAVDVANTTQVNTLFQQAVNAYSQIHLLVAAPGVSTTRHFLDLPEDEWDWVLDVNLKSLYLCGQAAARHMAEHGGGSIINITSQCSIIAQRDSAHYMASKGAGRMLTKAMALDLADHAIRVNALAPGFTLTGMTAVHTESEAGMAHRQRVLARIPMNRAAEPEEMVGAAVFLASDESSYVTGITLVVDGGYLAI
jgi:NAD(P)-dependent dehydrogenase (short-subunit alcohol dehydrogenase family)